MQGYVIIIKFTSFDIRNEYDFVYVGMYRDPVLLGFSNMQL